MSLDNNSKSGLDDQKMQGRSPVKTSKHICDASPCVTCKSIVIIFMKKDAFAELFKAKNEQF